MYTALNLSKGVFWHTIQTEFSAYHGSPALVDKEDFTEDLGGHGVGWAPANPLDSTCSIEACEARRKAAPHGCKDSNQGPRKEDRPAAEDVGQGHPEDVRYAEGQDIDLFRPDVSGRPPERAPQENSATYRKKFGDLTKGHRWVKRKRHDR